VLQGGDLLPLLQLALLTCLRLMGFVFDDFYFRTFACALESFEYSSAFT
jgi:hypothetical protein